ncbi:MAG TPA: cupin domain-containing protein [Pyrinomonadaceae bacterium]|nr:cupin domain-containing protein [Pyrinomonadaceae bacterium]
MPLYDWNKMEPSEITADYLQRVATGENVTISRLEVNRGSTSEPHKHKSEEVVVVLKGAWRFRLPSGDVTITPNQLLLIPPDVEHSSEALEDTIALDISVPIQNSSEAEKNLLVEEDPDQYLWAV